MNDMGSLRYLFKYIENSGAMTKMKDLGIEEGNTVKIEDFEFEYFEEFWYWFLKIEFSTINK